VVDDLKAGIVRLQWMVGINFVLTVAVLVLLPK
jgi:hypothetical protein